MPRKKNPNNYFTQDTENAIIRYNNEPNEIRRSRIYEEEIHYPFFKLTQNLIHTFKFYYTDVDKLEDLQHEVTVFLLSKLHHFDPSKGAKAFSYFGTIAKRWLIAYNEKNYKKLQREMNIEHLTYSGESDTAHTPEALTYDIQEMPQHLYQDRLTYFMDKFIHYCDDRLFYIFPLECDQKVADAVLELFRKREGIEIFNKKALYLYIREMLPGTKTAEISKITKVLKEIFYPAYLRFTEENVLKFEYRAIGSPETCN